MKKPLGEEMEFFRQYNEVLFNQLEKKILNLETANQQLRILAKEYRLQFKNISDVVFMIGTDFNISNISPSVEKLLGYKAEDFIGRPVSDLRHIFTSESFERAIANISKMLKGKIIPAMIYAVVAKDGTLRHIEINGSPLIRDGQVAGTISVARDITERKLMEEKLRREEQRFRALIEHSSDIIVVFNLEGTIIYINPAVERVLGFKPEERIGANGFELVHPDDMKFLADSFNTLAKDTDAPVIHGEVHLRHKDGSWRTIEAVGSNQVNNNVVESIIVNYRDITERKQSEEKLRLSEEQYRKLVEQSLMGIGISKGNKVIFANSALLYIFGYDTLEEFVKIPLLDHVAPSSREMIAALARKRNQGKESETNFEYDILRKDGETRTLHGYATHFTLGDEIYTQTAFEDITERKQTEEALRVSEERFRLLSESAFEAIVIHEEGILLNANDQYFKMFGYEPGEALGKEMISVTFAPEVLAFVKKQVATGSLGPYETIGLRKDGARFPIEILVRKMEHKGRIVRFAAIRDITERKLVEDMLMESEKKYRELSIIDDLTQLHNSRHFYAQIEIEIERSNRYGQPLTLLLLDIDRFKKFNDKYGHVEGDYVLSQLGQVIKRCLRDPDSAYRYGGEEFTIILPMTTSNEGIVTAKRIQRELRKETFSPMLDQKINMTVSIGLAQYEPMEKMKTFVQRVDKLMYQAKKDGRDRICPDRIRHERSVIG